MYRVHLDQFEGPLDLLLFFIRRDELDIHDIPVARITDEYLAYVRVLEEVDLDVAADFIYTAALLVQIKTRLLLPRPELDAQGEPVDPRRELVERLLAYMRYKEAADLLGGRFEARQRRYARGAASDERERLAEPPEVTIRASVFDLVGALRGVLRRALPEEAPAPDARHAVARETFAVEAQRAWVLARLGETGASFSDLVHGRTRAFVIATFLAVLDLVTRQQVRLVLGLRPEDFALEAPHAVAV